MATPGLAKFDSAAAMVQALARFLDGEPFPGLGQSALLRRLAARADLLPRHWREKAFATMGAREGVKPHNIRQLDTASVARWAADLYPKRQYPAVMIGSASGALVHLGAAFDMPLLPQTWLKLVRQKEVHPDDAMHAIEAAREPAKHFLEVNPDVALHHLHDPSQDRLMLGLITYFRYKYRRLPDAYREFLLRTLAPGGTIVLTECNYSWPVTRLGERHYFQFGALGGPTQEEYLHGGERVQRYLAEQRSNRQAWSPPVSNCTAPEAEWGFDPALREDVLELADQGGYRVLRMPFDDPEGLSAPVADLYRDWYRERGLPSNRLLIESFIVLEPYRALQVAAVPFWMAFNMESSRQTVRRYLEQAEPYDHLHLMLFAHGVDSIGLPSIEQWRELFGYARRGGEFLGFDPRTYPAHFATFGRYSEAVRALDDEHPLPDPLPVQRLESFVADLERAHAHAQGAGT